LFDQLHGSLAGGNAVQSRMDDVMLRAPPLDPDPPLDLEPPLDPKPFVFGLAGRLQNVASIPLMRRSQDRRHCRASITDAG
jgi:hypothetical protein